MSKYPVAPMQATVEDLPWLPGAWRGSQGEDTIEEHWSEPACGALMGMLRWIRGNAAWFYEIMTLEPENGGLVFRIKHFNPGLVGWEEKDNAVTFDLVQLGENQAVFFKRGGTEPLWMIYKHVEGDRIMAYFEKEDYAPKPDELFAYSRL